MDKLQEALDQTIRERVDRLRYALGNQAPPTIVHRFVFGGDCYALTHDSHMLLKELVAEHFSIAPMEVVVVGSAKLGFTIAPPKPRYRAFGNESDIDVAIPSPKLFERLWNESIAYYRNGMPTWPRLDLFRQTLFEGWIRPDRWPETGHLAVADDWWDFFRLLSQRPEFGTLNITGALYRSWSDLEHYQTSAVNQLLQDPLEAP